MIWNQSVFTFFELRDIARLENCIFLQKQEWKELVAQHIKHLHVPFPVKLQGGCAQWILQKQIVLKNVELGPRLNIHAPSCNVRVLLQAVEVLREGEQSDADLFLVAQNTPHLHQVHLRHRGFCALPHLAHYWPLLSVLDVNLTGQPGPTRTGTGTGSPRSRSDASDTRAGAGSSAGVVSMHHCGTIREGILIAAAKQGNLANLTQFRLQGCRWLGVRGLTVLLRDCPKLTHLCVTGARFTPAMALALRKGGAKLRHLELEAANAFDGNALDVEDVVHIVQGCTQLQTLSLKTITQSALAALVSALPSTIIHLEIRFRPSVAAQDTIPGIPALLATLARHAPQLVQLKIVAESVQTLPVGNYYHTSFRHQDVTVIEYTHGQDAIAEF